LKNKLQVKWLSGLSEKDQKQIQDLLRSNTVLLSRLVFILEELESEIEKVETNPNSYDSNSWAYKQAFLNGQKSSLQKVKRLFDYLGD